MPSGIWSTVSLDDLAGGSAVMTDAVEMRIGRFPQARRGNDDGRGDFLVFAGGEMVADFQRADGVVVLIKYRLRSSKSVTAEARSLRTGISSPIFADFSVTLVA